MVTNETLTLGAFLGTALMAAFVYWRQYGQGKVTPPAQPVLTGIGAELGSREDIRMLVAEVKRIADILEDKHDAKVEESFKEIFRRMDQAENAGPQRRPPDRQRRPKP